MFALLITLLLSIALDTAIIILNDPPVWFCVLFGYMSFCTCKTIVEVFL